MARTQSTLAERYRRLLLLYPREYRSTRGQEIVDTFVDRARDSQQRPTWREALNLLTHGLRCRLGRPASRTVVVWASLASLVCGLFAGAFATRLAWETAGQLPSRDDSAALVSQLEDSVPFDYRVTMFSIYDHPLGWQKLDTLATVDLKRSQLDRTPVDLDGPASVSRVKMVEELANRLRASDWLIAEPTIRTTADCVGCEHMPLPIEAFIVARRGDDMVELQFVFGDQQPRSANPGVPDGNIPTILSVRLVRSTPWVVYPVGIAATLLGAVIGWFVFGWASRRTENRRAALRALTTTAYGLAMFLWYLPIAIALPYLLRQQFNRPYVSGHPMWEWISQPSVSLLVVAGTIVAAGGLALAALPRRTAEKTAPDPEDAGTIASS